jgi:hypothetical protein
MKSIYKMFTTNNVCDIIDLKQVDNVKYVKTKQQDYENITEQLDC